MNDLGQRLRRWAVRALVIEVKVIAAVGAGLGIAVVLTVPLGILTGLTLSALDLTGYANLAHSVIQVCAFAIWIMASLKILRHLCRRPASVS